MVKSIVKFIYFNLNFCSEIRGIWVEFVLFINTKESVFVNFHPSSSVIDFVWIFSCCLVLITCNCMEYILSQLMRFWYLSYRWPAKAQASLHIRAVSPEPSLFTHMKYGSRRRVQPKIRQLAPLDGCACTFEEWLLRVKSTIITWDGSFYNISPFH